MKPLDEFYKSINPYAPGVAVPVANFGIRQAAIEFCQRTRLWRYEDTFTVSAHDSESISVPYGAVLFDIEHASFEGNPLEPKTTSWLDKHHPGWRTGAYVGMPRYLTQLEPNTLRLVPGQEGTINLSLILKPAQDCEDLPDFMADQYRETIAHGALGRILMTPNQPYTNGSLATAHLASFEGRLVELSGTGSTGQQRARIRTRATFM